MKHLFGSFVIAFSMYSRIPMPQVEWTKERMRYALCFFPLIGLVIGAAELILFRAVNAAFLAPLFGPDASAPGLFFRTGTGVAIPLLITGGIHMDGFLDVTDARRSYGTREKKLEILSDPHIGAFAVIGFGVYLLLYGAAFALLTEKEIRLMAGIFVLERALSGLSVVWFPMAKKDGLAAQFSGGAVKQTVRIIMAVYLAVGGGFLLFWGGCTGMLCLVILAGTFFWYYRMSLKEFGGITGDLAGYFLQCCERNAVVLLALCRLLEI